MPCAERAQSLYGCPGAVGIPSEASTTFAHESDVGTVILLCLHSAGWAQLAPHLSLHSDCLGYQWEMAVS